MNQTVSESLPPPEEATYDLPLGHHNNNGNAVAVYLVRSHDKSLIPYVSLHGVTLIALLRMGLKNAMKVRAYHQFVALPLYQDMAPWNIVFVGVRPALCCTALLHRFVARGSLDAELCICVILGVCVAVQPKLDYIDYDTKDHNYNALIPKLYEAMEVLFNYKRTVEDFKRCGRNVRDARLLLSVHCVTLLPCFRWLCRAR